MVKSAICCPSAPNELAECTGLCQKPFPGGFDDWRLPNINELLSIYDYSLAGPAIDITAFPGMASPGSLLNLNFWSSTTTILGGGLIASLNTAYSLRFSDEEVQSDVINTNLHVRAVRGGRCRKEIKAQNTLTPILGYLLGE